MAVKTETQKQSTAHIYKSSNKADGYAQWFLRKTGTGVPKLPLLTNNNNIELFICGERGFANIYSDLSNAKHSIDIIAWGFDPAMELERSGDQWPRGTTYGDLLIRKAKEFTEAKQGGKVRLLIWFSYIANRYKTFNTPGYRDGTKAISDMTVLERKAAGATWNKNGNLIDTPEMRRQSYNVEWFRKACDGGIPGLEVRTRDPSFKSGWVNMPKPILGGVENALLIAGTHHQKPILVDYDYQDGVKAVGYVMGLNSVTDYWDTERHIVDDPLRERIDGGNLKKEHQRERTNLGATAKNRYQHSKPYQDYACQVKGGALQSLNDNFCESWDSAKKLNPNPETAITARRATPPKHITAPRPGGVNVQITRTFPKSDKSQSDYSIEASYWQSVLWARKYVYIENQYFYYKDFAEQLAGLYQKVKDDRQANGGKNQALHIFLVIPQAEDTAMVPEVFESLSALGQGSKLTNMQSRADATRERVEDLNNRIGQYDDAELDRKTYLDKQAKAELDKVLGLNVSVAMLRTSNEAKPVKGKINTYREIYIHSKLMIIDDAYFTLGSANLNDRSMNNDSEINICCDSWAKTQKLRNDVFSLHSEGVVTGGSGSVREIGAAFKKWNDHLIANQLAFDSGNPLKGFILPYKDLRIATIREK